MRILLSAYACEPNKGSEPGVGWSWAVELAKSHSVWVITRDNNKDNIEQYIASHREFSELDLHFVYVGLPKSLTFWKKGRRGMRLYYMLWQKKAANIAKKLHREIGFDFVQHVSFVSYTQPTYMYKIGIPFVWGPISGGENIPQKIKIEMSLKEKCIEFVRSVSQYLAIQTISGRNALKKAKYIIAATEETKDYIPRQYHDKTIIMPAIGLNEIPNYKRVMNKKIKIIMAGRLIYWKAFDIGIKAFIKIAEKYPNVELHILGEGNQKNKLKKLAGNLLNQQIFFVPPVPHDEIYKFYSEYDLFLNTTLRDSGCMAMMEAMAVGVPCVAIAAGGPNILLGDNSECKIDPLGYDYCINTIAEKIESLIQNSDLRDIESTLQKDRARHYFTMITKVRQLEKNVYSSLHE